MQKFYAKNGKILCKNSGKREKNNGIHATFLRSLNLDNSLLKTKIKKNLFNSIFYAGRAFYFKIQPFSLKNNTN